MSLVSQSIKNLKGGISQQPDILRFPDQGALQVNGFSSEVEGLQKRPPSVHRKRLANTGAFGQKTYVHLINRDERERYYAVFTGSSIRVFDLHGTEYTVRAPQGWGYVTTSNPRDDLRMVTVADYTFVVNRNVTVAEADDVTHAGYPAENKRCIINVRGGQYGKTFKIIINGIEVATFTTPNGSEPSHINQVDTQYIINQLVSSLNSHATSNGWGISTGSGYILINANGGTPFNSLETKDGYNNQLMNGFIFNVQKFTELPVYAPDGYIVKVQGDLNGDQDDYYVLYSASEKIWKETVAPNIKQSLAPSTMPYALIRAVDGNFDFQQLTWGGRTCGDDDSNPMPSFVGSTINDVFFFRNRLGFLSGENIILSRSGSYFKFFPASVASVADTDPIDVAVSTNRISILKYAVPFSEELLLWSDQAQFVLSAEGVLTNQTIRLDLTTEFEVTDKARPYGVGRGVYFCSPRATFSSIRRYYAVQDVTAVKNAEDVSAHVPSYIPNGVFRISGSSTENFITVLTAGAENMIYVYKFLYMEEQLVQQSWSHWDMGSGVRVLASEMIGAVMYLLLDSASGIFLETLEFTQHTKDFIQEPYRLYMDRKVVYTVPAGRYNDDTFTTYFNLSELYGAAPRYGTYYAVGDDGRLNIFTPPDIGGWQTSDRIELVGNQEGRTFIVGEAYSFKYEFSKFLIKQDDGNGVTTEDIGRLQLRRAWVNYERSGAFYVEVKSAGRNFRYTMSGKRLNAHNMILGNDHLDTGQFRYPVSSDAKQVTVTIFSDTPNPLALIGGGWEGNYVRRSSGI